MDELTNILIYVTIGCFFFLGLSSLVSANLDDYKWDICDNVNLTSSNCDNFWDDFKTNLSGYFNYSDANMTYNITVEYHYNQTYEGNISNLTTGVLTNFTYNKTDIDKLIEGINMEIINLNANAIGLTETETDSRIDSKLGSYLLISDLNNSIPQEQIVEVKLPAFWKYFISITFIGMLGVITTIVILIKMDE